VISDLSLESFVFLVIPSQEMLYCPGKYGVIRWGRIPDRPHASVNERSIGGSGRYDAWIMLNTNRCVRRTIRYFLFDPDSFLAGNRYFAGGTDGERHKHIFMRLMENDTTQRASRLATGGKPKRIEPAWFRLFAFQGDVRIFQDAGRRKSIATAENNQR
jgi:hypothetical protein